MSVKAVDGDFSYAFFVELASGGFYVEYCVQIQLSVFSCWFCHPERSRGTIYLVPKILLPIRTMVLPHSIASW